MTTPSQHGAPGYTRQPCNLRGIQDDFICHDGLIVPASGGGLFGSGNSSLGPKVSLPIKS
jgi:hypothetical protein